MFSSCHSVWTRRRTATMLEGTRAGRKRNSDPTPTGKTSRSSSMLVFANITFLFSAVKFVLWRSWTQSVRTMRSATFHGSRLVPRPPSVTCWEGLLHHCAIQWSPSLLKHAPKIRAHTNVVMTCCSFMQCHSLLENNEEDIERWWFKLWVGMCISFASNVLHKTVLITSSTCSPRESVDHTPKFWLLFYLQKT